MKQTLNYKKNSKYFTKCFYKHKYKFDNIYDWDLQSNILQSNISRAKYTSSTKLALKLKK